MLKRIIYFGVVLIILVTTVCFWCRHKKNAPELGVTAIPAESQATNIQTSQRQVTTVTEYAGLPAVAIWKMKPKMYKYQDFPPKTEDGIRMWRWWNAMEKADATFELKMPIEFYGRVVDQSNNPVADAFVTMSLISIDGSHANGICKKEMRSDTNGLFSLVGVNGKSISIDINKKGYRRVPGYINRNFEFAAFFQSDFYLPDSANPVIFHLWKFRDPDPMYALRVMSSALTVDNKVVWLKVLKGSVIESSQVGVSVMRNDPTNQLSGYTITIHADEGAGVTLADVNDTLMYEAPESGYQPKVQIEEKAGGGDSGGKEFGIYLHTSDGNYAAMKMQINIYQSANAKVSPRRLYLNPSGCRNLQYRDDLRIPE
jgi:hypothetical protein